MTRYHATASGSIPFTDEEELEADAAELAYEESAVARAKLSKWEEIKAHRTVLLNTGGFEYDDHWYHSDQASKTEFLGLKLKALETMFSSGDMSANIQIDGTDTLVKTIDNGYMTVSGNKILLLVSAAEVQTKKIYTAGATHQYYLNLSETPSTYDFSGGWPTIYGEV